MVFLDSLRNVQLRLNAQRGRLRRKRSNTSTRVVFPYPADTDLVTT
jgi:hypothetical protein